MCCVVLCADRVLLCLLSDASQVAVTNFVPAMETVMRPYVNLVTKARARNSKRVGVLISGTGTNLQVSLIAYNLGCLNYSFRTDFNTVMAYIGGFQYSLIH